MAKEGVVICALGLEVLRAYMAERDISKNLTQVVEGVGTLRAIEATGWRKILFALLPERTTKMMQPTRRAVRSVLEELSGQGLIVLDGIKCSTRVIAFAERDDEIFYFISPAGEDKLRSFIFKTTHAYEVPIRRDGGVMA